MSRQYFLIPSGKGPVSNRYAFELHPAVPLPQPCRRYWTQMDYRCTLRSCSGSTDRLTILAQDNNRQKVTDGGVDGIFCI
jgi:hypothetical protein